MGRKRIYDWDKWFSARRFTLHRGVDYTVTQASMVQRIRDMACKFKRKIQIVDDPAGKYIVVLVKNPLRRKSVRS